MLYKNSFRKRRDYFLLCLFSIIVLFSILSCNNRVTDPNDIETGVMEAQLFKNVDPNKFLRSYSKYGVNLLYHDKPSNSLHFSYNRRRIYEEDFCEVLDVDSRVNSFHLLWKWEKGIICVFVHSDVDFEEFVKSYSKYEAKIQEYTGFMSFNHRNVNEYYLLWKLRNDPRVRYAEFNHIDPYEGKK